MLKHALLRAIRWYQRHGGSRRFFAIECNYIPTCSEYSYQAIERYGSCRGISLGWQRICRCDDRDAIEKQYDPLPEDFPMNTEQLALEKEKLRDQIATLPPEQRKIYYAKEEKALKDPDTYAVLNYFFLAGLHHFYLGKNGLGLLNVLAMLLGIAFIESFGWLLILAVLLFELPQLFRSQTIVQRYNVEKMRELLEQHRSENK